MPAQEVVQREQCGKCGAVRVDRQIGLEATPDEYLATMVQVFRQIRRVMRNDAVAFINMGDSYSDKQLLLMPARLALALQADGWWVRSDIIWHKPNPMPESVKGSTATRHMITLSEHERLSRVSSAGQRADENGSGDLSRSAVQGRPAYSDERGPGLSAVQLEEEQPSDPDALVPCPGCSKCINGYIVHLYAGRPTSAHEHVFLLTRSSRYFYDADAVREELTGNTNWAQSGETPIERAGYHGANRRGSMSLPVTARNLRNVWSIATSPYPNAHFATYPAELAERCIKAGTSERGCCAVCGKPWGRITDVSYTDAHRGMVGNQRKTITTKPHTTHMHAGREDDVRMDKHTTTTGWSPGCQCNAGDPVPCVVLDCFAGAGTTLLVADRLQRDAIGIELNTAYTEMAMERCRADAPLFTSFPPAEPPEDERMADLFTDMAAD